MLVSGVLCLYQLAKGKKIKQKTVQFLTGTYKQSLSGELPQDETWWNLLDTPVQLQLAIVLARKALPVWEKYSKSNEPVYKNSSTGPFVAISPALLQSSLNEIEQAAFVHFPQNSKAITACYNEFVAPLVALQDGNWMVTYHAKKIFMAVYNILKAITEQADISTVKSLLSVSINQSLDCIDMSRLYSKEEMITFLQSYRDQVMV
jgi:hypothetical protein